MPPPSTHGPDAFASYRHYVDHIRPVWHALTERGTFYVGPAAGVKGDTTRALGPGPPTIVAGFPDIGKTRHRPHILIEHGVGESWGGTDPHYSGGAGRDSVRLFIGGPVSTARNAVAYDALCVEAVPRLESLMRVQRDRHDCLRVVVSFHWDNRTWANTRSALPHFLGFLGSWAADSRVELRGHAHPRILEYAERQFYRAGIEVISDFAEVIAWADVYAADNSSTLFEAAACGLGIIYLDAPWYRYGDGSLRFDRYADLAPRVGGGELIDVAFSMGVLDYGSMTADIFGVVEGSARRAAVAIESVTHDSWTPSGSSGAIAGAGPTQPSLFGSG